MTGHRTLDTSTTPSTSGTATPAHGTLSAYSRHGCRCTTCRAALSRYEKLRELDQARGIYRSLPPDGTRRRLHALMAIGWTSQHLADQLGWQQDRVEKTLRSNKQRVYRRTALQVTALYDQLWNTPGPSDINRRRAAAQGWPPPLWWDDDLIDDPTHPGESLYRQEQQATTASRDLRDEQHQQVDDLTGRGWSTARIAQHLGISDRSVVRIRARQRTSLSDTARTVDHMDGAA